MDFMQLKIKMDFITTICVLSFGLTYVVTAEPEYFVERSVPCSEVKPALVLHVNHDRQRRDASSDTPGQPPSNTGSSVGVSSNDLPEITTDFNKTTKPSEDSDKIFKKTTKAEKNLTTLSYDKHDFYNSSFIDNVTYFQEYWAYITEPKSEVHDVLSNSYRRATTRKLSFDFPFYGHPVRNVTVATGGFIFTGDHVHSWLVATQYIAPLMANFDTTLTNDSVVKMYDDGEKFSVFWEKVTLQEDRTKKFTFAVTLYKNGDIVFAYQDVPIPVQKINDVGHPVKVGISDAYLKDNFQFNVKRKTIYEYHRVSFLSHDITNNSILKLIALPTCLQFDSCTSCLNHDTGLHCVWSEQLQKCLSVTDRNKQEKLSNCDIKERHSSYHHSSNQGEGLQ